MVMMMVTMESGHDDLKRRRLYGLSPTAFPFAPDGRPLPARFVAW